VTEPAEASVYERIYAVVRRIPRGRVCTYGGVAALAGNPGRARQVGYALHALPEHTSVPWHRVINAQGRISLRRPGGDLEQRYRLEDEGVVFNVAGVVSLERFGWSGRRRRQGPGETAPERTNSAKRAR
jgi:methylated-DNA-protein-cysteine methyltransferase-like protein